MDHRVSYLAQLWLLSLCTWFFVTNMYHQFSFCLQVIAIAKWTTLVQGVYYKLMVCDTFPLIFGTVLVIFIIVVSKPNLVMWVLEGSTNFQNKHSLKRTWKHNNAWLSCTQCTITNHTVSKEKERSYTASNGFMYILQLKTMCREDFNFAVESTCYNILAISRHISYRLGNKTTAHLRRWRKHTHNV